MTDRHQVVVSDDWVEQGAALIADAIRSALASRGRAVVAVSGGSTPRPVFERLASTDLDWSAVTITQVDERVAPDGHADRNLGDLEAALGATGAVIVPLPVLWPDPEASATWWSTVLDRAGVRRDDRGWPVFDVVHLGLGTDGHTASLIPGDPVLDVTDRVLAVTGDYQGRQRVTLTRPVLDRAAATVWLAPGAAKAGMVARLIAGDPTIPGGLVQPDDGTSTIVTDTPPG